LALVFDSAARAGQGMERAFGFSRTRLCRVNGLDFARRLFRREFASPLVLKKSRPMKFRRVVVALAVLILVAVAVIVLSQRRAGGSGGGVQSGNLDARDRVAGTPLDFDAFAATPIGNPRDGQPWITDLTIADLDGDGWRDVIACDARANAVVWIRQTKPGVYVEQSIGASVAGPAHVAVIDFDRDGDLDVLVASMGVVPPSNEKIGAVVVLENDGAQHFKNRVVLENTYRVTDVEAGDFDGDGDLDLSVAQFGYLEGQVQWLENLGSWKFQSHVLLDLAGAIHAPVVDIDGDGDLDVVALVAQDWEEVHLFRNDGHGRFEKSVVWGSTNKDYGSSGLTVGDIDGDGDPDIAPANGDGFDYATPGARPWHGVQWLENDGRGKFTFHRIGTFPGAYSPLIVDIDGDGDRDIVAVSGFNDWSKPDAVALMYFENDGGQSFTPRVLAHQPTHLIVVKGADMANDGRVSLVTGSFAFYPPDDRAGRVTLWSRRK
jgi:hypothetical protein